MSQFLEYATSTAFKVSLSHSQLYQLYLITTKGMPFQDYRLSSMRALENKGIVRWVPLTAEEAKGRGYMQDVIDGLEAGVRNTPGRYIPTDEGLRLAEFLQQVGMFAEFEKGKKVGGRQ